MAITVSRGAAGSTQIASATLLSGVTATSNGEWIEVRGLRDINVHITGITSATVRVHVSNATTKPADADVEHVYGTVTSNGVVYVLGPFRWLKASVPTYSSGTIIANMEAM